jgi:hypothetical protein
LGGAIAQSLQRRTKRAAARLLEKNGATSLTLSDCFVERQAALANSQIRVVKSLLQDACTGRTDFPRKWTPPKAEDVCGLVRFRDSIVPKRFT